MLCGPEISISEVPTYKLIARDFNLESINHFRDAITFNIYIQQTNTQTAFEYAGGQYYMYLNPDIANGGTLSCTILASDLPLNLQPQNPAITSNAGFPILMKLDINSFPGAGNGYIINPMLPGTRIAKIRLITTAAAGLRADEIIFGFRCYLNLQWKNPPLEPNASTRVFAYVQNVLSEITTPNTDSVDTNFPELEDYCGAILQLRVLIEGFYNQDLDLLNKRDSVTVYLRDTAPPYIVRDIAKTLIDSTTKYGTCYFPSAPSGNYYIVIKYPNSIETWGLATITKNICLSKNFTNTLDLSTSASQAYGNNLKLEGSRYCLYSGDVNPDGLIDLSDVILIYNDTRTITTGNTITDLNGDYIVDLSDLIIVSNNALDFVRSVSPLSGN